MPWTTRSDGLRIRTIRTRHDTIRLRWKRMFFRQRGKIRVAHTPSLSLSRSLLSGYDTERYGMARYENHVVAFPPLLDVYLRKARSLLWVCSMFTGAAVVQRPSHFLYMRGSMDGWMDGWGSWLLRLLFNYSLLSQHPGFKLAEGLFLKIPHLYVRGDCELLHSL